MHISTPETTMMRCTSLKKSRRNVGSLGAHPLTVGEDHRNQERYDRDQDD
jgi:serine protease inhibitor ecotin